MLNYRQVAGLTGPGGQAALSGAGATDGAPVELLFGALSDSTRRAMIDRLIDGPASVSELAAPLGISLPAAVQHVHVLEASGLVRSQKVGRVRTCTIESAALSTVERWIAERRYTWEQRLDRLGEYLAEDPGGPAGHDQPEQPDSRRKQ